MTNPQEIARRLGAMGYRRTSNKYGMVSRIDRADWLQHLAETMLNRVVADFCLHSTGMPSGSWCDYYRRCVSKDTLELPQTISRKIPTSGWDSIGYVELSGEDRSFVVDLISTL